MTAHKTGKTTRKRKAPPEANDVLIPAAEFTPLLWKRIQPLVDLAQSVAVSKSGGAIAGRVVAAIEDCAHDVETFLDDHEARTNQAFAAITEFVACVRGFAEVGQTLQHVASRFRSYRRRTAKLDASFLADAERTRSFADRSLRELLRVLLRELAAVSGAPKTARRRAPIDFVDRVARRSLPHDVGDLAAMNERQKIAELAGLFLAHARTLGKLFDGARFDDVAAMRRYVLEVSDEEQCRYFETKIHNLQSRYDTFIKSTELEGSDDDLKRFRGVVSIALHLIESMTQLVHFYERHGNDIRGEQVKNRVAAVVDKDEVLDRALNFCLYFAHAYIQDGVPLAERLVKRYTSQERLALDLPVGITLHIRPVSLIAEIVKHHATPVHVTIGSTRIYAGSVLDVLMLAGANAGERRLVFEGDHRPLDDLRELFAHRLGESGLEGFSKQLAYLRPGS